MLEEVFLYQVISIDTFNNFSTPAAMALGGSSVASIVRSDHGNNFWLYPFEFTVVSRKRTFCTITAKTKVE